LHMAQLMPLPLAVSCFSTVQIGVTFLIPTHPGSPGQRAVKRCVCVCVCCGVIIDISAAGMPGAAVTCEAAGRLVSFGDESDASARRDV